ncbi:MAG: reprolysin-like metallopeptidase [Chitinophagales bacterium]
MRHILLTTLCLLALIPATIAQSMWQPSAEPTSIPSGAKRFIYADEAQYFELDTSLWTAVSARIPMEVNRLDARQGFQVSIPMPNGDLETFLFAESPIMEASLAAQYPEISTYVAYCPDHPEWYGKFDFTPQGFHGMILGVEGGSVFIDPVFHGPLYPTTYISYHRDNFRPAIPEQFSCDFHSDVLDASLDEERELARFGTCELRTYRLALSATGEYTAFHGGTQAQAIAAQNTTMNRVNGVFERDIAITMVIVANNDLNVYTNAGSDPFSNGNTGAMINENVTVCNNNIGSANYDIGHVFGTNSGGLAGLGVVCSSSKARGVTGSGAPVGDPFDIDYVAHEMGHQFNMNHTQNNSCNRNGGTAVEPGSASTIMGYAGICAPNVQNNSDDYFHGISLQECDALITSGGHTCPVITPLSNSEPTLTGLSTSITIPANTPFALTAAANDPDPSDVLTYCWEQMDNQTGFTMPPSSASTGGPMFRSLDPSTSPTRYFPNLQDLIAGNVSVWEVLPSVSRSMDFRVTVRDNASGGGCNDHDDLVVNVDGNSGPFLVLNPNNSGITWDASTVQNVTWDVANTSSSPVSCGSVDILLSLDGGQTFSVIASNVLNDGSESITVPNTPSSNALIMVQCANGTFFDVSDNTFVINGITNDFTITSPNANQSVCAGGSTTFPIDLTAFGTFADPVSLSVSGGGSGTSASLSANNVTPTTSVTLTVTTTTASSGTNTLTISGNSTTGTKTLDVVLDVLTAPATPTLTSPVGGATASNPTVFTWSSTPGSTYDITIFSSINPNTVAETATGLGSATYTSNSLANATTYYYLVTANNACGSATSAIESFTTSSCLTLTNTTNYVGSNNANTDVLSPITVPVSATSQVSSVRIPNMQGFITRINDIDIRLVAPSGTEIILLDYINYCNLEDDWDHGIEDGGLNLNGLPCPPTDGLIYDPENPLSTFDNELAAGDWNLRVFDWVNGRTPTIDEWTLEICTFDPCGAPVTTNQTLSGCAPYTFNGQVYNASTTIRDTLTASNGCDSIALTNLVLSPSSTGSQTLSGCSSVTYNGTTYTSSTTLTETLTASNGCDSILTTNIIVTPAITTNQSFAGCNSYTYNGTTYTTSTTLTETLTTAQGCDSVVVTAINIFPSYNIGQVIEGCDQVVFNGTVYTSSTTLGNTFTSVNGCDSIVGTQIIVYNSVSTTQSVVGCGSVSYNGNTYNATTGLTEVFASATGCDSTVYTQIIVESQPTVNQTITGCDQVVYNGQTYTSSTTVTEILPSIGCDTLRVTDIVVNSSASSTQTITGCGVVNYNGNTFTSNQVLTEVFTTSSGCDSVVTTTIQIDSIVVTTSRIEGCGSIDYNGQTYTSNQVLTEISSDANGCDSITLVEIVVDQPYVLNQQFQACDSFVFNGITYTASTTVTETYSLPSGCDSVIRTTLIINRSSNLTTPVTACGSYTVNGNTYSQSQIINTYYTNQFGCDSIVQIDLTILPESSSIDNISSCESITWIDGNTYIVSNNTASVVLTNAQGCDSTVFLNFTLDFFETDIYFSQNGYLAPTALGDSYEWLLCDSAGFTSLGETGPTYVPLSTGSYAVAVSSQGCIDTSACLPFYVTGTGIMSTLPILPTLRPNPINESLSIDFGMRYEAMDVLLIDAIGQSVFKRKYSNVQRLNERLDLSAGVYFLWIESNDGGRALMRILKK